MTDEETAIVKGVLLELLNKMGIEAEIEVQESEGLTLFNLKTEDSGILIGQHGGHLGALQYMTRVLAHKKLSGLVPFVVDVEGYKRHREEYLRELARQAAARVRETKETLVLKPMMAYERRVIHAELSQFSDIASESEGEEPERRILIKPKQVENNA